MRGAPRDILICSCDDTMPLDTTAVRRGCHNGEVTTARQLCGTELQRFQSIAGQDNPLTVGCTFAASILSEAAGETGRSNPVTFANLRETAGWSNEALSAGPKMAALLAAAAVPMPDVPTVRAESGGVLLIYGRDEVAIEAGNLLKDRLDVTVLIAPPAAIAPPRTGDFPVVKGKDCDGQRLPGRLRSRRRRFRAAAAVVARLAGVRARARWRQFALRHHS